MNLTEKIEKRSKEDAKRNRKRTSTEPAKALGVDNEVGNKIWESFTKVLIEHITKNSAITGKCPPNGGPLTEGKLS